MTDTFYVSIHDPFADTLVALGLQRLLADLLNKQGDDDGAIRYVDKGGYIQLTLVAPIREETIANLGGDKYIMGGVRFVLTAKNADEIPTDTIKYVDDYEAIKEQNNRFYDAIKAKLSLHERPVQYDVLRAINPGGLPGWNNVLNNWWQLREHQSVVVRLLLDLYRVHPNPLDAVSAEWKQLNKQLNWGITETTTALQLLNPTQGKGQNRIKSDGMGIGNMDNLWLVEFIKMVGYYNDVMTKTVKGGKDRKSFVIAPRDLSLRDHNAILTAFKQTMSAETSIRFDVLASLRYAQALLKHYLEAEQDLLSRLLGRNLQNKLVGGFHTAFYKDMGNTTATLNISDIALPGWIVPHSIEEVNQYQDILKELIDFTRQFDEGHSDAAALLQHLRDFVSGNDLAAFFRLTNALPAYVIGMRERGKYAQQLTTPTIERIITMTNPTYSDILANQGFQNIAAAIRNSTVVPQRRKANGERLYEIRYGLGQDLTRVAGRGKEAEFLAALSDFIHLYNAETTRIYEVRKVQYRSNITVNDINDIVALVDQHGAPTIARLLVAYGYARVPKDEPAEASTEEQVLNSDSSDDTDN
ncbi:MAG: hypothetical protein ACOYLB_16045 [Phototrophicaceae bacterium]